MRFLPLLVRIFANDPPTNAKLIMNKINWRINVHAKSFVLAFRKTKFQINAKTKFLFFFVFFANICDKYSVGHLFTDPICFLSYRFLNFFLKS